MKHSGCHITLTGFIIQVDICTVLTSSLVDIKIF